MRSGLHCNDRLYKGRPLRGCVLSQPSCQVETTKTIDHNLPPSLPPFSLLLAFPFPARLVATKMFQPSNVRPIIQTHAGEREGIFALASDASALKISRVFGNHSGARVPAADSSRIPRGAPSHGVNSEGCWQTRRPLSEPPAWGQRSAQSLPLPSLPPPADGFTCRPTAEASGKDGFVSAFPFHAVPQVRFMESRRGGQ